MNTDFILLNGSFAVRRRSRGRGRDADLGSAKAIQWLQQDRARYWPEQTRKAQEWVVQARNDLDRCQLHYGSEDTPSCMDQKKRLDRAKRRLKLCEEKVKAVKRWINTVRQELDDFHGEMAKMNNWLETDLPRGAAALERMLRALDKYAGDFQSLEVHHRSSAHRCQHRPTPTPPRLFADARKRWTAAGKYGESETVIHVPKTVADANL